MHSYALRHSIGTKIFGAFLAMSFIIAGVGAYGYWMLLRIGRDRRQHLRSSDDGNQLRARRQRRLPANGKLTRCAPSPIIACTKRETRQGHRRYRLDAVRRSRRRTGTCDGERRTQCDPQDPHARENMAIDPCHAAIKQEPGASDRGGSTRTSSINSTS